MFNKIKDYIPIVLVALLYPIFIFIFDFENNVITSTVFFWLIFNAIINIYLSNLNRSDCLENDKVRKRLIADILRKLSTAPFFMSLFVVILFESDKFIIFFALIILYIVILTLRIIPIVQKYKDVQ